MDNFELPLEIPELTRQRAHNDIMDDKSFNEVNMYLRQVDLKEALMEEIKQLNKENAPLWFQVNFPVLYTELRVSDFIYRYNLRCSNAGKTHCV